MEVFENAYRPGMLMVTRHVFSVLEGNFVIAAITLLVESIAFSET
jgi:hypothetical protein